VPRLTKRVIDAATAKSDRYVIWDADIKGFGLSVLPSGVRSYIYKFRTKQGVKRQATIGKHGEWTPTQARQRAEHLRGIVRNGGDPVNEKRSEVEAPTVGVLLDAYLTSQAFADKAASTQAIDRGRIERHLRPVLGGKHAHLIARKDIQKALSAIRDGKTVATIKTGPRGLARVRGGPGTAKAAIDLLRAIFNWARDEDLIETGNPCDGVKTGPTGTRDTILEDEADYARLFKTLETMEADQRIRAPVADAIRLIALTGCRRGEASGLRWRHVDLKRGRIEYPPLEHKAGRKTNKPRIITLAAAAQAIIARQPEGDHDDFVFQPARGSGAINLSPPWRKVRAEAGLPEKLGLHGLRHSVATSMAMGGAEAAQIMTVLGHHQLSTVQRYIHAAKSAREGLAERAASVAVAGMAKAGNASSADVVKMRRGK